MRVFFVLRQRRWWPFQQLRRVRETAERASSNTVTFTKDVAPILQRSCQNCHRPGSNAPMSLMTYEDARPYARSIKTKTASRLMPPWHVERNIGIQKFKDDPSLTEQEIATIAAWVDQGAPKGDMAHMPAAKTIEDEDVWHIGKPDLIVEIPQPHVVPASRSGCVDRLHRR